MLRSSCKHEPHLVNLAAGWGQLGRRGGCGRSRSCRDQPTAGIGNLEAHRCNLHQLQARWRPRGSPDPRSSDRLGKGLSLALASNLLPLELHLWIPARLQSALEVGSEDDPSAGNMATL